MEEITLSQLDGVQVGQAENRAAGTGCTAVVAPAGVTASVWSPGFAPGSRELELLRPENTAPAIHGLLLAGGSAFGLSAAAGVVRHLRELGAGFDTGFVQVPLVPAAVIFDYPGNQSHGALPDETLGYQAALAANNDPVKSGPFGAGLSATAGKVAGPEFASPSGLGSHGLAVGGLLVAVLAVVNPLGSIVDPDSGRIVSGLRRPDGTLAGKSEILETMRVRSLGLTAPDPGHTVLVVVGTNARLSKLGAYRLARMAGVGLARTIYPAHLMYDGDTVFALTTNTGPLVDDSWLGALAADVVSRAILNSVPGSGHD